MARARSPLAFAVLALVATCCLMGLRAPSAQPTLFVPAPLAAAQVADRGAAAQPADAAKAFYAAALVAAATHPAPALALEDEEEGFDLRILAILALPLGAISWALFNVWRVAFRQVIRFSESESGSSAPGLSAED
mmetsp:Transcript_58247/g.173331  ORF Transcript_58247/g.173331 Transcript_58247/m.173331 type:complete len:135 (-) Transcript_58247:82-486(-)